MTQTIRNFERSTNRVFIEADYGQGRRGKATIYDLTRITKLDASGILEDFINEALYDDDIEEIPEHCKNLISAIANSKTNHIWRISSESGNGGAMDNVVEFHATFKSAKEEAMSQWC